VADAVVTGPFDPAGVAAGPLDHPGIGPVPPPGVEVLSASDAGRDRGEDAFLLLRGKRPPAGGLAADDADGPLELDPVRVDAGLGRGFQLQNVTANRVDVPGLRQAGDVVDLDYPPFFVDRVEDAVPPGPQAPQVRRPYGNDSGGRGSSASWPTVFQSAATPT